MGIHQGPWDDPLSPRSWTVVIDDLGVALADLQARYVAGVDGVRALASAVESGAARPSGL